MARRFALIVGVSNYPNFDPANNNLPSAMLDVQRLTNFAANSQDFDEVVVLNNEDATRENLEYFLTNYFKKASNVSNRRSQFLFAYSGHGFPSSNHGEAPQISLYGIESLNDYDHLLGLSTLAQWLKDLSTTNFSTLALINACYGGGIFGSAYAGANPDEPARAGGWALTAGADDELVWSSGKPEDGSIFFDLIESGIQTGAADPNYGRKIVNGAGVIVRRESMVRLGSLNSYLSARIEDLGNNPRTHQPFSYPKMGVLSDDAKSQGGFFFLAPRYIADGPPDINGTRAEAPVGEPGAVSAVFGRPEFKVFNDPLEYKIRGVEIGASQGIVDWSRLKENGVNFTYIKATLPSSVVDERFKNNWNDTNDLDIRHGAYIYFNFCISPQDQYDVITNIVPIEQWSLPVAIDLAAGNNNIAQDCIRKSSMGSAKQNILEFNRMITEHFRKSPILVGDNWAFEKLIDESFIQSPVWFHEGFAADSTFSFPGSNPWTVWQYEGRARLDGIQGEPVSRDVFFGSATQFEQFQLSGKNVALIAALKGGQ